MLNDQLPASVRERYDLIGFDPRGVGLSSPLPCGLTGTDAATAKRVADKCRKKSGDKLPHITTRDLVAKADRKPFKYVGEVLNGDGVRDYMRSTTFEVEPASALVVELKKAAAGKKTAPERIEPRQRPAFAEEIPADNTDASFWAVACGDNSAAWPKDPERYRKDAVRDKKRYPLYGDFGSNITPCAFWNKSGEPVTKVDNRVPSLIIQNEWDSQTPLATAQALHGALKGSKMVTVKGGEGHGVYVLGGSPCADAVGTAYLNTGKLPAKDTTCAPGTAGVSGTQKSPLPQGPNRF